MIEIAALRAENYKDGAIGVRLSTRHLQSLQPVPAPGNRAGRPRSFKRGESLGVPLLQPGAARDSRNLFLRFRALRDVTRHGGDILAFVQLSGVA